jgi:hypothetical protein
MKKFLCKEKMRNFPPSSFNESYFVYAFSYSGSLTLTNVKRKNSGNRQGMIIQEQLNYIHTLGFYLKRNI